MVTLAGLTPERRTGAHARTPTHRQKYTDSQTAADAEHTRPRPRPRPRPRLAARGAPRPWPASRPSRRRASPGTRALLGDPAVSAADGVPPRPAVSAADGAPPGSSPLPGDSLSLARLRLQREARRAEGPARGARQSAARPRAVPCGVPWRATPLGLRGVPVTASHWHYGESESRALRGVRVTGAPGSQSHWRSGVSLQPQ